MLQKLLYGLYHPLSLTVALGEVQAAGEMFKPLGVSELEKFARRVLGSVFASYDFQDPVTGKDSFQCSDDGTRFSGCHLNHLRVSREVLGGILARMFPPSPTDIVEVVWLA